MRVISNAQSFLVEAYQNEFSMMKSVLVGKLSNSPKINRGKWQSEQTSVAAYEIRNALVSYSMPQTLNSLKTSIPADFEWADEHFNERVGGQPLNPAPSFVTWPYHSTKEAERHVANGVFSHTYPERMWPIYAGDAGNNVYNPNQGIRYIYGDTQDVVVQLQKDPFTRQAYLPIWFPEDTGAIEGQRVPCTLGYHFIRNGRQFDCNYFIRSCDIYRHFTNDIYLAIRLTQWIHDQLLNDQDPEYCTYLGSLNMFISNLHMFESDEWRF